MSLTKKEIEAVVEKQRMFFRTGKTLDIEFRVRQLNRLKKAVIEFQNEIVSALEEDLGRTKEEAYFCDIGTVIAEINETIAGVRKWARTERHYSGMMCFPSMLTKVHKMPYGTVLIISPFNFPFLLSLGVLTAAIAGGNTAVIKASSKSVKSTEVLRKLIGSIFPEQYCFVADGGHDVADMCLDIRFDKIFYTGSPKVARHVMAKAAENLTPVALELGGETGNWCIVRKDADLKDAARKIAFFKICNAGQICININQVAVAEEVADEFLNLLMKEFTRQIGEGISAVNNPEYPKLITPAAYNKCRDEAQAYAERIIYGGIGLASKQKYAPTIIYPVKPDESLVNHELFSPLLPVVPFKDSEVKDLLNTISSREHGLALYLFTRSRAWADRVMSTRQYGGGCVNEVCLHLMVKGVPFNGTGHSGMGAYHGIWGFREFTHPSTVLYGSSHFNLPLREHPYSGRANAYKMKFIKMCER